MRSRLEKRAVELEQQHGHYAMFAAWREWFVEWNARQPEEIQVDAGTLDETSLFAMCCEFLSGEQEQTYTMSQAIDQIVDGLRLEWVDYDGVMCRVEDNILGMYSVRCEKKITAEGAGVRYWWIFQAFDGHDTPERPRRSRGECDSFESGKTQCLDDYRTRFRSELEKAVANHG